MKNQKKHKKFKFKPYPESKIINEGIYMAVVIGECKDITEMDIWITLSGQMIFIKNLRDSHLKNIAQTFKDKPHWRREQQPFIYAEIERRRKKKLIKDTKAGKLFYDAAL